MTKECECGNIEFGFDCVCNFVADNPGETEYSCTYCGIYTAGRARCSECETGGTDD